MILFALSFLGISSVWSDFLQEEGKCTKEKNMCKIKINEHPNQRYLCFHTVNEQLCLMVCIKF